MTVYVEYVLIDNLVIDYLLLKSTLQILGKPQKKLRSFLCAFLGSCLALVMPLLSAVSWLEILYKCFSGLLIFSLCIGKTNIKEYYRGALIFFALTFLTGGAITGIFNIFKIDYSSEICTATIIIPAYLIIVAVQNLIKYLYKRKNIEQSCIEVIISVNGVSEKLKGFIDTGNMLFDGDSPVIILSKKKANKFLQGRLPKLKYIEYETVAGKSKMLAISNASVQIYLGGQTNIISNVSVGVSKRSVGSEYDVILHPFLLKESLDEKRNNDIQKVS